MVAKLNPYLNFNGQAAEALAFYKESLDGEVTDLRHWRDMPGADPASATGGMVMHSELKLGGGLVMLSDSAPDCPGPERGGNASVCLHYEDVPAMEAAFVKMSEGGKVDCPMGDSFWGARFGMLTDRFGVSWLFHGPMPKGE